MEVFIGTILPFGFSYAPVDWSACQGQTRPISQYNVVYALLGTTFGGDARTNFQLPNLQGRFPTSMGQGPSGFVQMGQAGGTPSYSRKWCMA